MSLLPPDLPLDREIAFTDDQGQPKPRLEKNNTKLLARAATVLQTAVGGTGEGWPAFAMALGLLVIEKLITIYHATHFVAEFLPEAKELSQQRMRS